MDPKTLAAFEDELQKIAASPEEVRNKKRLGAVLGVAGLAGGGAVAGHAVGDWVGSRKGLAGAQSGQKAAIHNYMTKNAPMAAVEKADKAAIDSMSAMGKKYGRKGALIGGGAGAALAGGVIGYNMLKNRKKKTAASPKDDANALFGLPLNVKRRPGTRKYETEGSGAAASPDRSTSPVTGQSTANVAGSNTVTPVTGPGGV
jgi:hypothetical protein